MKFIKAVLFIYLSYVALASSLAQTSKQYPLNQTGIAIEKVYIQTDRDFYFIGDTIWFKAYLQNGQNLALVSDLQNLYVELIDGKGKIVQKQILLCEYGQASGSIAISDTTGTGPFVIRAYTDFQKNFGEDLFFHKVIRISEVMNSFELDSVRQNANLKSHEIDVSFFPEGGFLLAGMQNIIAFKAIDQTGIGIPISGKVLNSNGEAVMFFKTDYKGMGRMFFNPEHGESYEVSIDAYPDFTYQLEDIRSEGMKLALLHQNKEEVTLKIQSNSRNHSRDPYYVVCYARDSLLFKREIAHKATLNLKVETKALLGGINRFILLNRAYEPVSERLVFVNNLDLNKLEIKMNQTAFDTRSPVLLDVIDDQAILDSGYSNLSITVVSENALNAGGVHQNIVSYLFLDSELKGYIESPADYFVDDEDASSKYKLNLLMLTNGWCNYLNTPSVSNSEDFPYSRTAGITIKGNAERLIGKKPIIEGDITLGIFKDSTTAFLVDQTDSSGCFIIDSLFFYDTATVFTQVLNQRGKQRTNVYLEEKTNSEPTISRHLLDAFQNISDIPLQQYSQKYYSDLDYQEYNPDDKSIPIEEVKITERKVKEKDGHTRIYIRADHVLEVTPSDYGYTTVYQYLQSRVPGLRIRYNQEGDPVVQLRGSTSLNYNNINEEATHPLFILDGIPISFKPSNVLMGIPMSSIDKVEILNSGSAAIFGSRGARGVIAVYTKKYETPTETDYKAVGTVSKKVTGFSSRRKFYSPKYTPENINTPIPDHRTTLYWNPNIITKNGKANLSFYTADDLGYFRIIMEGVTNKGKLCFGTSGFFVNSRKK